MKIKVHLQPTPGLFALMPATIWPDLDVTPIDIELWTRIGSLEASPLFRYFVSPDGVLDTTGLAALIYQRYAPNWKRIYDTLSLDYNIAETSSQDWTRSLTRTHDATETRNLSDVGSETEDIEVVKAGTNVRTGAVNRTDADTRTINTTDTETRNLTGSDEESGTETHATSSTEEQTGTGTGATQTSLNGVGAATARPTSSEANSDTRDYTTVVSGSDSTTFGKATATTEGGTVETTRGGTEGTVGTASETYDDLTDASTGTDTTAATSSSTTSRTGTVGEESSDVETEEYHSKGSSALSTYQALINEELAGRTGQVWNFVNIVILDVQHMIALKVWGREEIFNV